MLKFTKVHLLASIWNSLFLWKGCDIIQNAFFWWQPPLVMFLHAQQTTHGTKHNTTLEREKKNPRILTINFWVPEKNPTCNGGVSKPLKSRIPFFEDINIPTSPQKGGRIQTWRPFLLNLSWKKKRQVDLLWNDLVSFTPPFQTGPTKNNKENSQPFDFTPNYWCFFVGSSGMKRFARGPVAFRMARPISTLGEIKKYMD